MKLGCVCLLLIAAGCKAQLVGGTSSTTSSSATSGTTTSMPAGDDRASGAGGSQVITLPDTMGMTRSEAEAALRGAGVGGEIRIQEDANSANPANDRVCLQSPGGGQQSRTSLGVTLTFCAAEKKQYVDKRDVPLEGLTVEEATKRAKAAGFEGRVEVVSCGDCAASCKLETVCFVRPRRWYLNIEHVLELYVPKTAEITVPD